MNKWIKPDVTASKDRSWSSLVNQVESSQEYSHDVVGYFNQVIYGFFLWLMEINGTKQSGRVLGVVRSIFSNDHIIAPSSIPPDRLLLYFSRSMFNVSNLLVIINFMYLLNCGSQTKVKVCSKYVSSIKGYHSMHCQNGEQNSKYII